MIEPNLSCLWAPDEGKNFIRILPAYPRTEEDFYLENREHDWVLMNIITFATVNLEQSPFGLAQDIIRVWKTDVNVLYAILNLMVDKTIGDITHLEHGRRVNVYQRSEISKRFGNITIYAGRDKEPLPKHLGNVIRDGGLPNLKWVDKYLSNRLERKLNKYRRIDLG